jgi:superfamily II DNA or RNA helicase
MKSCKIIVCDEVNCRLHGLELSDRRALTKQFEYEIPGARYLPSVRLGRWNGKVSYFQLSGSTYINLLDQIIPYLTDNGYDIELDDSRDYTTKFTFNRVTEDTFSHKTWPSGHVLAGQNIVLRDYQIEAVNNFLENPQCINVLPTGAGKTLITAALSYSIEGWGRSIVIVPNKTLVTQTEADYVNLGLDVGVYYGDRKDWNKKHTICTWQSLLQLIKNTKNGVADATIQEFTQDVVCVICDEVHTAKSDSLKTMLSGIMSTVPIRWGLTGTIPKEKYAATALEVCIGPVLNRLEAKTLQDMGVLANCHVNIVQTQDHREYKDYQSELKFLLSDKIRLDTIANLINKIVVTGNTLILVDRVAAGHEIVNRIPDSVFISGDTKLKERKEEYDEVATSTDKVIVATYGVAAVGINIPRIFNLILIECGRSYTRVIQSIGRGLRKASDKEQVEIWDICSSCRFSKRHLTKRKEFYREVQYKYTEEKVNYT